MPRFEVIERTKILPFLTGGAEGLHLSSSRAYPLEVSPKGFDMVHGIFQELVSITRWLITWSAGIQDRAKPSEAKQHIWSV